MNRNLKAFILKGFVFLGMVMLIMAGFTVYKVSRQRTPALINYDEYVYNQTSVRKEVYYTVCNHMESVAAVGDADFAEKTFAQLRADGWYVFRDDNNQVVVFKESAEYCPNDAGRGHLAMYEGTLALFRGSLANRGEMLEIIDIAFEKLPAVWQRRLENGGIEFQSEEDMLSALESLDELR